VIDSGAFGDIGHLGNEESAFTNTTGSLRLTSR
jgi:hypothetical protein